MAESPNAAARLLIGQIDVLLAQAETLKRLGRKAEAARKLSVARAISVDLTKLEPESARSYLTAAKISMADGSLDFAADMLKGADDLTNDPVIRHNIAYETSLLKREREIAGGSQREMIYRLFIYSCQKCGEFVDYISLPCHSCDWRPTTLREAIVSLRISNVMMTVAQLATIGRGLHTGRPLATIIPNLEETVADDLSDGDTRLRDQASGALAAATEKSIDNYFSWRDAASCSSCGLTFHRYDAITCRKCGTALRLPPPLRLFLCLGRLLIHLEHNILLRTPDSPRQPTEMELFAMFLCSLHSKLYRTQETPTDRERSMVLTFMESIGNIWTENRFGLVDCAAPGHIVARFRPGATDAEKQHIESTIVDLRDALIYLANWMAKTKALC